MKKVVVALGGNAILDKNPTAKAQKEAIRKAANHLLPLIKEGYQLIITHGNGPQVGNLLLQQEAADSVENPALPLDSCVAMTQGSIGFWIQNELTNLLAREKIKANVVSVVTQVEVDKNDPAFKSPNKPIGPFLTQDEVNEKEDADQFMEDAGRGFRKVVPSPKPISIIEHQTIYQLSQAGNIVIAAGGGGIPVVKENDEITSIEAVIDKDFAAAKLAELVEADMLLILTGVDNVFVNYNQPDQKKLTTVTTRDLEGYVLENQFAPGSMLPKIEAGLEFVYSGKGKTIITSLENAKNIFDENMVTTIIS